MEIPSGEEFFVLGSVGRASVDPRCVDPERLREIMTDVWFCVAGASTVIAEKGSGTWRLWELMHTNAVTHSWPLMTPTAG